MQPFKATLDLSKTPFALAEIPNIENLTSIRLDNCAGKISIPLALNQYPKITALYFYGRDEDAPYEIPENLDQLMHIKTLSLWSFCDFATVKPMHHLEELYVAVKDPLDEVRHIAELFPHLKKLEIWGGSETIRNRNLSENIGQLADLECLHLVSCKVKELPDSMANLQNLRELNLRGLPMNHFPEVITELKNLECLVINQAFTDLPEGMENLQKLKQLDLEGSLNKGSMSVTEEDMAMRGMPLNPIPGVIGKLKSLEDLNLNRCGVFDIAPIAPLHQLKKLSIQYGALKNCDGFSALTALETLNLESNYDLRDLHGLAGLPLKDLNIDSCRSPSIAVINTLPKLETLNISCCRKIIDFSPAYLHPQLKHLDASNKVLEKWKRRGEFSDLPAVETLIQQLETAEVETFAKAIHFLQKHVDMVFNGYQNPLASFFQVEAGKIEELTHLPVLDDFIAGHIKNISSETLVNIFCITFKSIACDHFNATLQVLEEVVLRRDIAIQKRILDEFYRAMEKEVEYFMYKCNIVYTQIMTAYFPRFESNSLVYLLEKANIFDLGADCLQLDSLFLPAFQNTQDEALYKQLIDILFDYKNESDDAFGEENFAEFINGMLVNTSDRVQALIAQQYDANQDSTIALLRNYTKEDLPQIIPMLGREISAELWRDYGFAIADTLCKTVLSDELLDHTLDFLSNLEGSDSDRNISDLLASQWHKNAPENIIAFLKNLLAGKQRSQQDIYYILKMMFMELHNSQCLFAELEIYRNFLWEACDIPRSDQYSDEIAMLLQKCFDNNSPANDIPQIFSRVEEITAHIEGDIEFKDYDLEFEMALLAEFEHFEEMRWMYRTLSARFKEFRAEAVLQLNLIAATKLNDKAYLDSLNTEISTPG